MSQMKIAERIASNSKQRRQFVNEIIIVQPCGPRISKQQQDLDKQQPIQAM